MLLLCVIYICGPTNARAPAVDNSYCGVDASPGVPLGGADAFLGVPRGGATASVVTDLHGGDADAGGVGHANDGPKSGVTAAGWANSWFG